MPKAHGIAMWSFIITPDTKFTPCWRTDLILTDAEAMKLKEAGLKVKRNDDGQYQFKFKRNVTNKKGQPNRQPIVVDENKEPFNQIIGNGSEVTIIYKLYEWKNNFGKGIGADLDKIMVHKHVPYEGGSADEDFDDAPVQKKHQDDEDF